MERQVELREAGQVYATEMEAGQSVQVPVVLMQGGQPVGVILPYEEYRVYKVWRDAQTQEDEFPAEWYVERDSFKRLLPELLHTHAGKWVAIQHGVVIDTDYNPGELMWRVSNALGETPVYFDEVRETPRVYRVPSAWVRRK